MGSIESYYFICDSVNKLTEGSAEFSRHAKEEKGSFVTEMLAPFFIMRAAIRPHFVNCFISFIRFVKSGEEN